MPLWIGSFNKINKMLGSKLCGRTVTILSCGRTLSSVNMTAMPKRKPRISPRVFVQSFCPFSISKS